MPQKNTVAPSFRDMEIAQNTIQNLSRVRTSLEIENAELRNEAARLRAEAKKERQRSEHYEGVNAKLRTQIERYEALCPTMSEAQKVRYLKDMETYDRVMEQTGGNPHTVIRQSKWA